MSEEKSKPRGLVHCRICKKPINRDIQSDWMMPSTNFFYHIKCYNDWAKKKDDIHTETDGEMWHIALLDYLWKEVRMPELNFAKAQRQWEKYVKEGMTPKGIYFCVKYFYEVQKGDPSKAREGIGIVPYIYKEGCEYWCKRELTDKGICEKIEQQILAMDKQRVIDIKRRMRSRAKIKTYNLEVIEEGDDKAK